MTSYLFNGAEPWLLITATLTLAYTFRLIPTIRLTITKETQYD